MIGTNPIAAPITKVTMFDTIIPTTQRTFNFFSSSSWLNGKACTSSGSGEFGGVVKLDPYWRIRTHLLQYLKRLIMHAHFGGIASGRLLQSQIQSVFFPGGSISLTSLYLTCSKLSNSTWGDCMETGLNDRNNNDKEKCIPETWIFVFVFVQKYHTGVNGWTETLATGSQFDPWFRWRSYNVTYVSIYFVGLSHRSVKFVPGTSEDSACSTTPNRLRMSNILGFEKSKKDIRPFK